MRQYPSDIAFTPSVKAIQERLGSRNGYARMEQKGGWSDEVTLDLAAFIAERDSFYLATATADGQPYIQHRGGPKGFLHVLNEKTLAFADFAGNKQYISMGNLAENDIAEDDGPVEDKNMAAPGEPGGGPEGGAGGQAHRVGLVVEFEPGASQPPAEEGQGAAQVT